MPTRNSAILLTSEVGSRGQFFTALASALRLPGRGHRPAPTNLDDMADLLRETHVDKVICSHCSLDHSDEHALRQVFDDLGIAWVR